MKPGKKLTPEQRRVMEERSLRGESVYGVPVSTMPASFCYGVILRNACGKKLLSRHDTLDEAAVAADIAHSRFIRTAPTPA